MANAEEAERNIYGSFVCVYCGETFTDDNPCWNSFADYEDGSHADGECKRCAAKHNAGKVQRDFVNYRGE